MSKGMPTGKAVLFMAVLLGAALAGSGALDDPFTRVHSTCADGIDNNADGFIDVGDLECVYYPWKDGTGEKSSTVVGVTVGENGKVAGSGTYESSAFAYWLNVLQSDPLYGPIDYCDLAQNGYIAPGPGWDNSFAEANTFKSDPANGCPP